MARHRIVSSRGHYYVYKLLVFFILIALSLIAAESSTYYASHQNSNSDDGVCAPAWISLTKILTFGVACKPSEPAGGAVGANESDSGKTIWNPLAKSWLTDEQVRLLKVAFDVGYEDGGIRHARLVQSTLLQESIAGQLGRVGHRTAPVGKRSYGVMQVKVTAAQDVLQIHTQLSYSTTVEDLIVRLMTDDEYNIRVASKYLLYLREKTSNDASALVAYNVGLRGAKRYEDHDEFRYVKSVNRYFESVVIPFNQKYLGERDGPVSPI